MVEINCLYLRNLPRRPRSNENFVRLLLRHVNDSNVYVKNPSLPIPTNEPIGNADLRLLDDQYGIAEVSRSTKLENQCFITFVDPQHASKFKDKFQSNLVINGRQVDVQYAEKNSLLGLALISRGLLDTVLKRRRATRRLMGDESLARRQRLRRKLRRLRSKLRAKGITQDDLQKITDNVKEVIPVEAKPKRYQAKDVIVSGNPPNKILLVQNLPPATTLESMTTLFKSPALVEIRLVNVRHLAFVEYESTEDAISVRNSLGSQYNWEGHQINIEFAK